MLYDHFTDERLDSSIWQFCNMTTPCLEMPHHVGDSCLALPEHDMWNEGNCLLSRAFLQEHSVVAAEFSGWDEECTGCGVGFYAGDSSFGKYVLLTATDGQIELRVHSGSQNGESFMSGGQPKWLVIAKISWDMTFPVRLTLQREGNHYTAKLFDEFLLEADIPEISGDARALIKALSWRERFEACYTYLDWAMIDGIAPTCTFTGQVLNGTDQPVECAGIHLSGFDQFFTLTDQEGYFTIEGVPRGNHMLIASAEGYLFTRREICCIPGQKENFCIYLQEQTSENTPRREYNRPLFDRSRHGWLSLNGTWQFQFDPDNVGIKEHWYEEQAPQYDRHIRVPFSWASLMGFGEEHFACGSTLHEMNTQFNNYHLTGEHAWYRRSFTVPDTFPDEEHVILHIGASSNVTYVWLDNNYLGMRIDEYSDLEFDLGLLEPGSTHVLVIKVQYPHDILSHNMGKQIFWFSSAPGIWQSVWIEPRAKAHLTRIRLTPYLDFADGVCIHASVLAEVAAENAPDGIVALTLTAPESGRQYQADILLCAGEGKAELVIDVPELWEYRHGRLYEAVAELMVEGKGADCVRSHVGLRKVESRWLPGHSPEETDDPLEQYQYLYLNDRPFYVIGILDQCYNAFGIYTYRSLDTEGEEGRRGSIRYDIDRTMAYGYNLSRVHIKENEPLWYDECDRRGQLVWTEHPGNFYATPEEPRWQEAYYRELDGMLERLHNHPSIVIVSTINESWGVEGCHVSTPWENELRYQFLRDSGFRAKKAWPHVLVCDNSGFGKTEACENNDFHYYPADHWEAKERWKALVQSCYPGSDFNYINRIRAPHCVGEAVQTGRPIFISEFLHINGIDMQLRMFQKIAGYLRMNVASHEMEDSGPLTAERYERDYGYVDHHMVSVGYDMVNNMDMVIPDCNRIEHVQPGQRMKIDIYTSHFAWRDVKDPVLHVTVTGIDRLGRYTEGIAGMECPIDFKSFMVEQQEPFEFIIPENIRGAYVFLYVENDGDILCRNYIQLYIEDACTGTYEGEITIAPGMFARAEGDYVQVFQETDNACAVGICGNGELSYAVYLPEKAKKSIFIMEAGAREGKNAIKVTDEILFGTQIDVYWDNVLAGTLNPPDDPSDERALFSNGAQGGNPYNYRNTGRLGYGERFEIPLPTNKLEAGEHVLMLRSNSGGMTIYGRYTGRYGMDPTIITIS